MACLDNTTINLGECLNFQGDTVENTYPSIASLLNNLLPNIFIFAGLVIFFLIFFGGFTILTNAGNPNKQNEGQQIITGAVIGFLVIILSYLIIQIIEIITGIPILHSNL